MPSMCDCGEGAVGCVQAALRRLWEACFPDEQFSEEPTRRWTDAGFQGADPSRDFRGGGIYSLLNLIYMSQHYEGVFQRLLHKSDGTRSEIEYPFSVAGAALDDHRNVVAQGRALVVCQSSPRTGCCGAASNRMLGLVQGAVMAMKRACVTAWELVVMAMTVPSKSASNLLSCRESTRS